ADGMARSSASVTIRLDSAAGTAASWATASCCSAGVLPLIQASHLPTIRPPNRLIALPAAHPRPAPVGPPTSMPTQPPTTSAAPSTATFSISSPRLTFCDMAGHLAGRACGEAVASDLIKGKYRPTPASLKYGR